ncbi:MAG: 2-hydroxyacid dehydrogenase [Marinicellaceae bacterium]
MTQIIAFCSQISITDQQRWLTELNRLLVDVRVISFQHLSNTEKQKVQIAIVANPKIADLNELKNLQWIQSLWSGVEKLVSQFSNKQIKIIRMIDPKLSHNMAEAVLTFTLFLHRNIATYIKQQSEQIWLPHKLVDSNKRHVGILGLGELGKASALKLLENDFNVSGWSRSPKRMKNVHCLNGEGGFIEIMKKSEILICLLPLTNKTQNLLNKRTLGLLPKGASLINFSRGHIINEKDLLDCLNKHHLKHAVLDVFNSEPLPGDHPFWQSSKITVLPHISAPTDVHSASIIVAKNIKKYLELGEIPHSISRSKGY